ncbi:oxidoreductase, Gfo/Idh/MocA family [Viridothelium virens]|uniref:Oxidoreductase, Gfo/Idh/MocA family n=1 Tax=Viridothelium virens TaxID=1048519 RepID=A0A6A6HIR9_VIRVR|nr:oxidoreductase, Gfo/Idh/MocA family [Viridothelium virens]
MVLTFGVIGTSWITDEWISGAHATGLWKLTSVYSRTRETAEQYAAKYDVSSVHTSIESLAGDAIQVIYVASPNSLHYEQTKLILQHKRHVILEKPATTTVAEFEDLCSLARVNGVYLIEAYRHIQEANFQTLKSGLTQLGQVYGASLTYASFSSRYTNVLNGETPNVFSLDFAGGSLVDIGVYPITFAVALFGRPRSSTYQAFRCRTGTDGGGFILLQYENFSVSINQSKCYNSAAPSEIYGENGTVTVNATMNIDTVKLFNPRTKETKEWAGPKEELKLKEEAAEFARIIQNDDKKAAKDLEDLSRTVLQITTELRRQNGIIYPADKI